jgi:hypothetical protein
LRTRSILEHKRVFTTLFITLITAVIASAFEVNADMTI